MVIKLTDTPNPVAPEVPQVDAIHKLIKELQYEWTKETFDVKVPWWEVWKQPIVVHKATLFLLLAADELVLAIDKDLQLNGPQKKAVVLAALNILYNSVVSETLPLWVKPFSTPIKDYVINVLLSDEIDFLVAKYHSVVWGK